MQISTLRILQCDGARESFHEAISHLAETVREDCIAQFKARHNRLASGQQLRSPDHFRKEAALPNGSHFYAIKTTQGLRAYGWYSANEPGVFWISHFIYKATDKLRDTDKARVEANWRLKEKFEGE